MRVPLTDALRRDLERHQLRWACVHCAHVIESTGACAHGWPNEDQRRFPLPEGATELPICKEFELG